MRLRGIASWNGSEADPRHAEAYDRIALADGPAADMPARRLPEPANDRGFAGWGMGRWLAARRLRGRCRRDGDASRRRPTSIRCRTASGETRQVALGEGSRVEISGGSRLSFDRNHPRQVTVERGEALFHVRHDAADPFTVRSGCARGAETVGTVFNIVRDGRRFSVAGGGRLGAVPAEARGRDAVRPVLPSRWTRTAEVQVVKIDPGLVGSWRQGRLALLCRRLFRRHCAKSSVFMGQRLLADRGLFDRRVTGIITLSGEAQRTFPICALTDRGELAGGWRALGSHAGW